MADEKEPKLGSGERFKKLSEKLEGKVKNPKAVAASIGRKKYGAEKFRKLAAAGRGKKAEAAQAMNQS